MAPEYKRQHVTNEERRDLLKALGVAGAVAAGSATFEKVQTAISAGAAEELAPIGQAIAADLAGELEPELIATQSTEFAEAATSLPAVVEKGFPEEEPRDDFAALESAGRPVYEHLVEVGFFESTAKHIPQFTPEYIESSVRHLVAAETLTSPLTAVGFDEAEMLEFIAPIVNHRDRLSHQLWLTTEQIPDEGYGKYVPPMTRQAAGGVLLWFRDIDQHLWQDQVLLTETTLEDITWNAHAMAAGYQMMTEGAKAIAEEESEITESELTALLSSGFALQTIAQNLLPVEGYWITEEMRGDRRTDLETITKDLETIKSDIIGGA
jgi:hypothetical protein